MVWRWLRAAGGFPSAGIAPPAAAKIARSARLLAAAAAAVAGLPDSHRNMETN